MKLGEIEKFCHFWKSKEEISVPIYQVLEIAHKTMPKLVAIAKEAEWILSFKRQHPNLHIPDAYFIALEHTLMELENDRTPRDKSEAVET